MPKALSQDFAFHVCVVMCSSVDVVLKILPASIDRIPIPDIFSLSNHFLVSSLFLINTFNQI